MSSFSVGYVSRRLLPLLVLAFVACADETPFEMAGPAEPPELVQPHYTQLAMGWGGACALDSIGYAYCWDLYQDPAPSRVPGPLRFTSIDTDGSRACGLTAAGAIYCWDRYRVVPTRTEAGRTWASISLGFRLCAVDVDGAGYCEDRFNGEGLEPVPGDERWASISTGGRHSCGVTTDGEGFCWGVNHYLVLGQPDEFANYPGLVPAPGGDDWLQLAAGGRNTCGIRADGTLLCWGANWANELGAQTAEEQRAEPVAVLDGALPFDEVFLAPDVGSHSYTFVCGRALVGSAEAMSCWGGFGGPIHVDFGRTSWKSIEVFMQACGLTRDGRILCWDSPMSLMRAEEPHELPPARIWPGSEDLGGES